MKIKLNQLIFIQLLYIIILLLYIIIGKYFYVSKKVSKKGQTRFVNL